MNDTINAVLAGGMLAVLALQLANQHQDRSRWFGWHARSLGRALVGVYLLAVVFTPITGQTHDGAQTALLFGLVILLLVRWRRSPESR